MAIGDGTRINGTSSFDKPVGSRRFSMAPMDSNVKSAMNQRRMDRLRDRALKKGLRSGDMEAVALYQSLKKDLSYKNREGIQNSLEMQDLDKTTAASYKKEGMRLAGALTPGTQQDSNEVAKRAEQTQENQEPKPAYVPSEGRVVGNEGVPKKDANGNVTDLVQRGESGQVVPLSSDVDQTKVEATKALSENVIKQNNISSLSSILDAPSGAWNAVGKVDQTKPNKDADVIEAAKALSEINKIRNSDLPLWQKEEIAGETLANPSKAVQEWNQLKSRNEAKAAIDEKAAFAGRTMDDSNAIQNKETKPKTNSLLKNKPIKDDSLLGALSEDFGSLVGGLKYGRDLAVGSVKEILGKEARLLAGGLANFASIPGRVYDKLPGKTGEVFRKRDDTRKMKNNAYNALNFLPKTILGDEESKQIEEDNKRAASVALRHSNISSILNSSE